MHNRNLGIFPGNPMDRDTLARLLSYTPKRALWSGAERWVRDTWDISCNIQLSLLHGVYTYDNQLV